MLTNLRRLIRRELAAAYDNGGFAATNDVVTTRAQMIEVGEERIAQAIAEEFTAPEVIGVGGKGVPKPTNVRRVVENVLSEALGE